MKNEDSFITLPWKLERNAPDFEGNDIKSPESLARYFIKKYTKKGDKVFDPFTGLGTTLFVTEELERVPYGIEAERAKYEWVAGQLENWMYLINGDAAKTLTYPFPKMDFSFTSPPYMKITDKWNPLYDGDPKYAGYDIYLKRMRFIYKKIAEQLKRNAIAIVQVDNIDGKKFTPLARDISNAVSKSLTPIGEVTIQWDSGKKNYPHTHCLIFKKT